jgi:diguanylate cyclase (GGDEF)-like protein/PAS domain S-box-containing protein
MPHGALLLLLGAALLILLITLARMRDQLAGTKRIAERLQISLWASGCIYWDWDFVADRIQRSGDAQLHGNNADGSMSGNDWRTQAVHPDDLLQVELSLRRHLMGEAPEFVSEHRIKTLLGTYIWVRSRGKIIARDAAGNAQRMAGVAVDISQTRASSQDLLIAQEALHSIAEGVLVLKPSGMIVNVNPAFERLSGYRNDREFNFFDLASARNSSRLLPDLVARTIDLGAWSGELWLTKASGEDFCANAEFSLIPARSGETAHIVVTLGDLSERKRAEIEVSHLTNFDTLTNLPNRAMLMGKLQRSIEQCDQQQRPLALLFINVDRFTQINESLGQSAGDELLRNVALRLAANAQEKEFVARFGGDEFVLITPHIERTELAHERCQDIRKFVGAPMQISGAEITISISGGLALAPVHGDSAEALIKASVVAMQVAKSLGGDAIFLANAPDDSAARQRILLEQQLRRALEREEFFLTYQPIYSLGQNRIVRFEALLRWRHPEHGVIGPDQFIPILEATGLITPVGEWVIESALQQLSVWRADGFEGGVAINVSPVQLARSDILEVLRVQLAKWQLPGDVLELELTETNVMRDAEYSIALFQQLKLMGVSIAIDDFGTGYSSLSYLRRLPIQKLKIDQSFIRDLADDADDLSIVDTILAMAKALNLETIAEGVETAAQLAHLRQRGCDAVQGYLIAKPLSAADAAHWTHSTPFAIPSSPTLN